MKKNPLITGTILLTGAGFLSRILGFFYRIFLSRAIGAEGLGVYQMVFPIHLRSPHSSHLAGFPLAGPLRPLRACLRPSAPCHGFVHPVFFHSRLHLRLLLWYEADRRSGTVPDGRTACPHGSGLSHGSGAD